MTTNSTPSNTQSVLQQCVFKTRYARFLPEKSRREHWPETVDRYMDFMANQCKKLGYNLSMEEYTLLWEAIHNQDTMPSMRALMTAGKALSLENLAGYNCAYLEITKIKDFSEALYILMNGTGVGFSCEREAINKLPEVPADLKNSTGDPIVVEDSKLGWAEAYYDYMKELYAGVIPTVDYSKLRPAGAKLKTFGGRASGPDPLQKLMEFTTETFKKAAGRKLTSIEVHDIMCTIGEIVVVGGVRRSALISLSNFSDLRMREAKVGAWWEDNKQRALANNSVAYTEKPDVESFIEEFFSLIKSKSGERGIFNRVAARKQATKFGRRRGDVRFGCNPCSEIILRPKQLCNLTEVVCRREDTVESVRIKLKAASILGTIQASLTNFKFVSAEWANNCREEALLGVSLTGIFDCPAIRDASKEDLESLREYCVEVNREWAEKLGINPSGAVTCVKPSGTVSQLVDSASGIHPRHAKYYVRNIRLDNKDPICEFLRTSSGIPNEPDANFPSQTVFSFPCKTPDGGWTREDMTATSHLKIWKHFQDYYCEHKPSVTISVKQEEWPEVMSWVWKNFDDVSGISFLPHSDHSYKQAPYIEITKEEYEERIKTMPTSVDWDKVVEEEDVTTGSQEMACEGEKCVIG